MLKFKNVFCSWKRLDTRKECIALGLAIAFLSGCGGQGSDASLKTVKMNYEGNKDFKAAQYQQAMDKYVQALTENSFVPDLHLNIGLALEMLQQAEKAQLAYQEAEFLAEKIGDPRIVFAARFNQAQLLGKAKKIDEALAIYQKCLEIIPSSKEVKTNIELLTKSEQGQGGSDSKDQKDNKDNKDNKDQKDKNEGDKDKKQDQNKGDDQQDKKDQNQDKDKNKQDPKYQPSAKYKPRPFEGKELSEGDVKKILGEIKQQESKIRAEYNRKDMKEQPRDKDW